MCIFSPPRAIIFRRSSRRGWISWKARLVMPPPLFNCQIRIGRKTFSRWREIFTLLTLKVQDRSGYNDTLPLSNEQSFANFLCSKYSELFIIHSSSIYIAQNFVKFRKIGMNSNLSIPRLRIETNI